MKKTLFAILLMILVFPVLCQADTYVGGYYRSDGTYVQPHYRSSPNSYKYDHYGSDNDSGSSYDNPYTRDYDNDGTPNYIDYDDDNDGTWDDNE